MTALAVAGAVYAFLWASVACAHARYHRLAHPGATRRETVAYGASWPARGVRYWASAAARWFR